MSGAVRVHKMSAAALLAEPGAEPEAAGQVAGRGRGAEGALGLDLRGELGQRGVPGGGLGEDDGAAVQGRRVPHSAA
jgi:hypothetical protein